jgi:lipoic acid synthetase
VTSGSKFRNEHGFSAIKDGIKRSGSGIIDTKTQRKPSWLRVRMPGGERYEAVRKNVSEHRLSTVCQESHCPNIGECWANGTATIMVMGSVCTRACKFCAVDTGNPKGWLDHEEPENTAKSVELMGLRYIVLTSVDRDDLEDGGAAHYAACVSAIKGRTPHVAVEALTPDFDAIMEHVEKVVDSGLDVFAQNVETVKRLTTRVRDPRAGYEKTLSVLAHAKRYPLGRTKQIAQQRHIVTFDVFKQQRRATGTQRTVANLGDFQVRINFDVDTLEFTLRFKRCDELTQVFVLQGTLPGSLTRR